MMTKFEAITLSEHDITAHAGEQIFGVSRYTDELDPTDNDLDSIHTFPAQMPDRDRIHPDWVGKISAKTCSKHLHGLSGDGALVFQQTKKGDHSDILPSTRARSPKSRRLNLLQGTPRRGSLTRATVVRGVEPRLPPQAKDHARSRSQLFEGELGASGEPPPASRAAHRIAHSTSPAAWITASPRLAACSPSHHRLERVTGLASVSRAAPVASRARATPRARPPTAPRSRGMGPYGNP